ncbi:MAG: hypothetical protein WBQ72_06065 [Terriglobales bacterium]|jgi:hypothetical protein
MRRRSIVGGVLLLGVMVGTSLAQTARRGTDVEPPALEKILANAKSPAAAQLADLIDIKPEFPLGPSDVLKEYQQAMALIAVSMSAEVANISRAQEGNQISREQAEYLIEDRYQVAMMQYQVLSALHDMLEQDVAEEAARAKRTHRVGESDTAVVVSLPASGPSAEAK